MTEMKTEHICGKCLWHLVWVGLLVLKWVGGSDVFTSRCNVKSLFLLPLPPIRPYNTANCFNQWTPGPTDKAISWRAPFGPQHHQSIRLTSAAIRRGGRERERCAETGNGGLWEGCALISKFLTPINANYFWLSKAMTGSHTFTFCDPADALYAGGFETEIMVLKIILHWYKTFK